MSARELLPPDRANPENPEWHELRRTGITASEIAAVMGISPWESPFSCYWRKTNGWATEKTEIMAAGHRLEPAIADWWASLHPYYVVCPAGLYASDDRPYQLATPDRLICDPQMHDNPFPDEPDYEYDHFTDAAHIALLECKWVAYSWDGWGEPGTDDIPVYYRAQCLWQADVLGVDEVHVAALGPGGFRAYVVHRDEDDLALMRKAGAEFHRRLTDGDPPDLDSHAATLTTLKRLYPAVGEGDVDVAVDLAERYRQANADKKAAKERIARCEAEIRAALGGDHHRAMCNGKLVASRSVYDRKPYEVGPATIDKLTPGRADSYA